MAEVEAVGALNWDRILFADRFADRGKEVGLDGIRESVGGSAANTASWLAPTREVNLNGYLGTDAEADWVLRHLRESGIRLDGVERVEGRSGQAFVISEGGERTIYVRDGVNDARPPRDDVDLIHMSSFFRPGSLEAQAKIVKEAAAHVSFAPGFLCGTARRGLRRALIYTDVLVVTEEESEALGELSGLPEILAVTLGERGCMLRRGDEEVAVPAEDVRPVDVTGAGDAFAAGLIDAYLDDADLEEMGLRGNRVAAECLRQVGGFRKG
ncbi:MAG: Nucleoside kinase [Methanonatronarchaeales archaeon]|nr:Nucleoside kinase [Methanonatronarchaeales archaeon]